MERVDPEGLHVIRGRNVVRAPGWRPPELTASF